MEILVAIILTFLSSCVTGQEWYFQNQTSNWTCRPIRTQINSTIVAHTFNAESLTRCVLHCTKPTSSRERLVSLYFDAGPRQCHCNSMVDVDVDPDVDVDESQPTIRYCTLKSSLKIDKTADKTTRSTVWPYHQDCYSLFQYYVAPLDAAGADWQMIKETMAAKEGVHVISPGGKSHVDVWCDMPEYENSLTWSTVIQRRLEGTVNFNRSWRDYVEGFGDATGEYWLGLKYLHLLTKVSTKLTIELDRSNWIDSPNGWPSLNYYKFSVGDEASKYVIKHQGIFNSAIVSHLYIHDMFSGQNELRFSSLDNDNDNSDEQNLAADTQSGWWIGNISEPNPNIPFANSSGSGSPAWKLFSWPTCDGLEDFNVNATTMKLYRYAWSSHASYCACC